MTYNSSGGQVRKTDEEYYDFTANACIEHTDILYQDFGIEEATGAKDYGPLLRASIAALTLPKIGPPVSVPWAVRC